MLEIGCSTSVPNESGVSRVSNVVPFPSSYAPEHVRHVEPVSLEVFVAADEARKWTSRHVINGLTILQCAKGMFICDRDAQCTAIYYADVGVEEQLAAIAAAIR